MPNLAPLDASNDNPLYRPFNAQAVGAAATVQSDPIDCSGYSHACVVQSASQASVRTIQISSDGAVWTSLVGGGFNVSNPILTIASGGSQCQVVSIAGARLLRIQWQNTSGAGDTVSAWVSLLS